MRISDWSSDVCSSDLTLHRWPQFKPSVKEGPILPDFDIRLASLSVGRLTIAKAVTGQRQAATLRGRVEILSGRARVDLAGRGIGGEDRIIVNLDSLPDADRFALHAEINPPAVGRAGTTPALKPKP